MRGIPNMQVFAPADEDDLVKMLPQIWDSPYPSYVRICNKPSVYQHDTNFKIGKAEIISEGTDIMILVYGFMFEQAIMTAQILREKGLSVGFINLRSLKPVDEEAILKAVFKSKLMVTIEDHFLTGGLYSIVAEILTRHKLTTDILPISLEEGWFKPARLPEVLEYEGFTGKKMAIKILDYFKKITQDNLNENDKHYQ
jgi:transketolase